jgi:hypothetical protein
VPEEEANVTVIAPAVVVDETGVTLVGAVTLLVSFWGPATDDVAARYPLDALAVTVT